MSIFSSSSNKDSQPEPTPTPHSSMPSSATGVSSTAYRSTGSTVISKGTQVDGNVRIEGDIQLDGLIKGTLTSKGKVVIGTTGVVEGDVLCQHAEISGRVKGKLKIADILFLKASALVDGDIQTGKLVMESGVQFNGNCSMGSAATVPSSSEKKPVPTPTAPPSSNTSGSSNSGSGNTSN